MFAVSSVDAAKAYYDAFKQLQHDASLHSGTHKPLRVATIFSFAANEEQSAVGDITDESFDVSAMNSSAKEFLDAAIDDYNGHFKSKRSISTVFTCVSLFTIMSTFAKMDIIPCTNTNPRALSSLRRSA